MRYHHSITESAELCGWSAAFAVMAISVVMVNTLTLMTFIKTKFLLTRKHVIIINITIADLLFGAAGLSSGMLYLLKPSEFSFFLLRATIGFTKMSTLISTGALAVERMCAIGFPLRHKVLTNRVYKVTLISIWIISAVNTIMVTVYWADVWGHILMASGGSLFFSTGVVFMMVFCHVIIWILFRQSNRRHRLPSNPRDKALAITLLYVTSAFIITWVPLTLYLSIAHVCKSCVKPTQEERISFGILLALGIQSLVNTVIYCFRLQGFIASLKALVKKIKCLKKKAPKRKTTVHPEELDFCAVIPPQEIKN